MINNNNDNINNNIIIIIIISKKKTKKGQKTSTHTHTLKTSRKFNDFNVYFLDVDRNLFGHCCLL